MGYQTGLHVAQHKTQVMTNIDFEDNSTTEIEVAAAASAELPHKCSSCTLGFKTKRGMNGHCAPWCLGAPETKDVREAI